MGTTYIANQKMILKQTAHPHEHGDNRRKLLTAPCGRRPTPTSMGTTVGVGVVKWVAMAAHPHEHGDNL